MVKDGQSWKTPRWARGEQVHECDIFTLVLWHCWLGNKKDIQPVKSWVLCYWWWQFDWSFAHLIAPVVTTTSIILAAIKLANPGSPGKIAIKTERERERERERLAVWSIHTVKSVWHVGRPVGQVTFMVDFFEHCQLSNDVEFGGNDVLQVYNTAQVKHRLNTTGMYIASTKVHFILLLLWLLSSYS